MTNFKEAEREALEFLRSKNDVGVVATIDGSGGPFASPVYYVMGEGFNVFFLTSKNTNKAQNLERNSKVAFSVGTGPEYASVMIRGLASSADSAEQNRVLPLFQEKMQKTNGADWPVRKLDELKEQNLALYKISPEHVTFLNLHSSQEPQSGTEHLYHLLG